MAEPSTAPGTAALTDRRPVPRGVLPRRMQTWIMAGLATGMVLIMFVAGRPEPSETPTAATAPSPSPSADHVRAYQDRLRLVESRAAQDLLTGSTGSAPPSPVISRAPVTSSANDPMRVERQRREYESLFASNVVVSRRPEAERPDANRQGSGVSNGSSGTQAEAPVSPSIDEVADAVVRATERAGGRVLPASPAARIPGVEPVAMLPSSESSKPAPQTDPISAAGPLHRLLEGTVIDTVLTTRLDGGTAAPMNCLVTNPVYAHGGRPVVIPAGARVLGATKPVQAFGETRLAVAFHRLVMPDGSTRPLDQFVGLNQIGEGGLRDRVDQHYWSTFGAAGAIGLVTGLAQYLGTTRLGDGDGDRTVIMAGGAAEGTAQASVQVMNRYLNRLPTITIREGHRVKVYLTRDLELPAYDAPGTW
jgi:type IV secretion system protein TrbI